MMISRLLYNIRQALSQIGRNKGMTVASLFAITAMMLILSLFFSISVNVNLFTEMVKQDYDSVEVFLKDDATEEQVNSLTASFKEMNDVASVTYRTKDQAMQIMRERWGESGYLLDSLGSNPLPNSILVKVNSLKAANAVSKFANTQKNAGVESTTYYKETVDKLTRITKYLQVAILVIMLFLVVVSVVVVSNTIKLTVFARAREISIEKYIGATNWFIRGPFLIEGILIGLIASLISAVISYGIYRNVVSLIGQKVMTLLSSPLVPANYLIGNLIIIFMAMGVGIGACGSIISMRKFLDA
ncbi:MAG: permease-like cell division protein FtsX [Eubacteriales bacterium]|nr:permease-like cell division protein FtsX [Eubacteriales bacterium]